MLQLKSFFVVLTSITLLSVFSTAAWRSYTRESLIILDRSHSEGEAEKIWTELPQTVEGSGTATILTDSARAENSSVRAENSSFGAENSSVRAENSSVDDFPVKLPWTSLYGNGEDDSYHFFSAYYDNRPSAPDRPAVLIMGYVYDKVKPINFYCIFKYPSGKEICRTTVATSSHPSSCFIPLPAGAKPKHFFCHMKSGEEPPLSVKLSTSSKCEPEMTSGEIPVQNRKPAQPTKKFGVCVGGPLIQESRDILQDLVQFIEMSRLLGADIITFYANETQIDRDILEYIRKQYPDTVRIIGWKWFAKWTPLHYFGQVLIISDCYYRNMYEFELLAQIDIDEMILPVAKNNWHEMVEEFRAAKTSSEPSVFIFQNAFFDNPNPVKQTTSQSRNIIPKYFTHTRRYKCAASTSYRTKIMTVPRFIVEPSIHSSCKGVNRHTTKYMVPPHLAIVAHYRISIPDDCLHKRSFTDTVATKYEDKLNTRLSKLKL